MAKPMKAKPMESACCPCTGCRLMTWVVAVLLFIATVASIIGVWRAHFPDTGVVFGATSGSLALLALGVNAMLWLKVMKRCCGCCCKK